MANLLLSSPDRHCALGLVFHTRPVALVLIAVTDLEVSQLALQ